MYLIYEHMSNKIFSELILVKYIEHSLRCCWDLF